jgi:hypothetical protein
MDWFENRLAPKLLFNVDKYNPNSFYPIFFLISINPFGLWVVYLDTAIINIKTAKKN